MRTISITLFLAVLSTTASANDPANIAPTILGQKQISTKESKPVTINLTDLTVLDFDDTYPQGFTLKISSGDHYTFEGQTVTPDPNFDGTLKVPVRVNDGQDDSRKYDLRITVVKNVKPQISGQEPIGIYVGESFTMMLLDLKVSDSDNIFPDDFTLKVFEGTNYTLNGATITPSATFKGSLSVPVTVNDGLDESNKFNVTINVTAPPNVKPKITGQQSIATGANHAVPIPLTALIVDDPDNGYPADFTMKLYAGSNYTISGLTVTPAQNFTGTLSVKATVNDGAIDSDPFNLQIQVLPENTGIPQIVGQSQLRINEDEMIPIEFADLKVEDKDSSYPAGFTINLLSGKNYKVVGRAIAPDLNYNGYLLVGVTVSDGKNTSAPFNLAIIVNPVNDPPQIVDFETEPIMFEPGNDPVGITAAMDIVDVDNEKLNFAEIGIRTEGYSKANDVLMFTNTSSIRGLYDADAGILSLIGNASVAEYRDAIRSIRYDHRTIGENDEPIDIVPGPKTIYLNLNDGQDVSLTYERVVTLEMILLDIPTGFTPNGDMANDTWEIRTLKGAEQYERAIIKVYNKRGRLVYSTSGFDKAWDGMLDGNILPADTYFYTIDLKLSYAQKRYQGAITILH